MLLRVLAFVAVAAVARAALVTDPNDARSWQGATVGTFAQLIYGANTLANRQLIVDNQLLDDGVFVVDSSTVPGQLTTAAATSCGFSLNNGASDPYAYSQSGCTVTGSANAIDTFWFQSSGTVGADIFTLPIAVSKVAVFTVIDHGPMPGEALESTVYLSNDQTNWVQASVERVWLQGYLADDVANNKNLFDGFTVAYGLGNNANNFRYVSITHGGPGAIVKDGDNELNGIVGLTDNYDAAIIPEECETVTVNYVPLTAQQASSASTCVVLNQNCDAGICETNSNNAIDIYYTTYSDNKVAKVAVTYTDTTFSLGPHETVKSLSGADGIIGNPGKSGELLVGAQGTRIHRVTTTGTIMQEFDTPVNAFHLTALHSGLVLFTNYLAGPVGLADVSASGALSNARVLSGDRSINTVIKTPYGFYYTSSDSGGSSSSFGKLSFFNGATPDPSGSNPTSFTTEHLSSQNAHSGQYDPFSDTILLFGGNKITQVSASSGAFISAVVYPDGNISMDQGALDGKGHAFVADNNGKLVYLSWRQVPSKVIGNADFTPKGFASAIFLENALDDVAPLIGAGGTC